MFLPPDKLIAGATAVILREVLPALKDKHARTRAWAVVDILGNLEPRVEAKRALLDAETESALEALRRAVDQLRRNNEELLAQEIGNRCDAITLLVDPQERVREARAAVVHVLRCIPSMDAAVRDSVLAEIDRHLADQALRDAMSVRPTPLAEIAQG